MYIKPKTLHLVIMTLLGHKLAISCADTAHWCKAKLFTPWWMGTLNDLSEGVSKRG